MSQFQGHVTVDSTLVFMECQPGWGPDNENCGPELGVGQIFKWSDCGGPLVVRNSIIRLDQSITRAMTLPEGSYQNVWLIHPESADGAPVPVRGQLPPGVHVISDERVWNLARRKWMNRHGCDDQGAGCTMTERP